MKLSEAIRKGSELRPQAFDWYFNNLAGGGLGSCALGAAYEATGGSPDDEVAHCTILEKRYPQLAVVVSSCPTGNPCHKFHTSRLYSTIGHLNDDHKWTREQIADWVEQFESEGVGA